MKIIELTAENFKKLKAVHIHPDGNIIQITGANAQGKSSVLDAIWAAIDAAGFLKATKTQEPIRQGEKKATITLDLGELTITRKFLPSGPTVEVLSKDGAIYKSPQGILDELIGKISFDPLAFSTMEEKKQRETLLSMVDIGIDLGAHATERALNFDQRTETNRTIKQLEGQLSGIAVAPDGTPDEELKSEDILTGMQAAQKTNEANQLKRGELEKLREQVKTYVPLLDGCDTAIADMKEQIAELETRISDKTVEKINLQQSKDEMIEKGKKLAGEVGLLKDIDLATFTTGLAQLEQTNKNVRAKIERTALVKSLTDQKTKSEAFTTSIADMDQKKEDAIKAAVFPIPGLGFDDNGVTYGSIPFAQCSSAERLRVSIAMAMSMNPKLRVIRIADGSLLDKKNMAIIEEMAKDHDFQCFIERVDESGTVGIVIEDGSVKEIVKP